MESLNEVKRHNKRDVNRSGLAHNHGDSKFKVVFIICSNLNKTWNLCAVSRPDIIKK